jgi:arylsulfatase
MSYGRSWANASNSPFRMYKHWVHEGGISTPFVVQWPRTIPAGSINHDSAHLIDIMATCVDLAGAVYPREFRNEAIIPLEGQSLRPVFDGRSSQRVGAIFWEHEGNRAVRLGELKLVSLHGSPWELYRMDHDRTEMEDLSLRYGRTVRQMESLWLDWARRSYVEPWELVEKQLSPWWT